MRRILDRLFGRRPTPVAARAPSPGAQATFEGVDRTEGVTSVLRLVPYLLDRDIARDAAADIETLAGELDDRGLVVLDEGLRERAFYQTSWWQLTPNDVPGFVSERSGGVRLIGLLSSHRSGFVREAAVKRLLARTDGAEVPYLLIRANDWVEPVRRLAHEALVARLRPDYVAHLAAHLPLVLRLGGGLRFVHRDLVDGTLKLLLEARPVLEDCLGGPDFRVRRACWQILTTAADRSIGSSLIDVGLRDRDPVVRLEVARFISTAGLDLVYRELDRLLADGSSAVRLAALELVVARLAGEAEARLRELALDESASVREAARFHLRLGRNSDIAALYRDALRREAARPRVGAVMGLGEVGLPTDVVVLAPLLGRDQARLRRAAIRSVARLDGRPFVQQFIAALRDPAARVARAAGEALASSPIPPEEPVAALIRDRTASVHSRCIALDSLVRLGRWRTLPYLLAACADEEERLRDRACIALDRWLWRYNRSFTAPSAVELDLCSGALDQFGGTLSHEFKAELTGILTSWKTR